VIGIVRTSISLDRATFIRLKAYTTRTGVPVSFLVRKAVADYLERTDAEARSRAGTPKAPPESDARG